MGAQIQTKAGLGLGLGQAPVQGDASQGFSASRSVAALLGFASFESLSPEQVQSFKKQLGTASWTELESLAGEKDPELFYEGLLHLGHSLQGRDRPEWALGLYSLAAQSPSRELAARAKTSIEALEGRGEIGARAEVLLSRFAKDASDPTMILPMLAGTSVAGLVRSAGLGRLAAGSASWYSRGWGARLTAGSLAYAVEVPTFVASGRALRSLGAQPQASWGQDLTTGAVSLGLIKLFGVASKQGLAQAHGINEWGAITRGAALAKYSHPFAHQASLFGGLMTSHWAEKQLGLRPQVDGATSVTDTLASMLSLGVGMRLGTGLLGRGYAQKTQELEFRTQSLQKAMSFPAIELPNLTARTTAAASGLGLFLQSSVAHAGENSSRWNPTSLTATILSSLAVGGAIGYGVYRIRRAYVAPTGRISRLRELQQDIPTMLPDRLAKEVDLATALLKESSTGDRRGDAEAVEGSLSFLEASLSRLETAKKGRVISAVIDLILVGKENFSAPALRVLKRSLPVLEPAARQKLLDKVHQATQFRQPDKALTAFFLLNALASGLGATERREVYNRAIKTLDYQRANFDNNAKLLFMQRALLRELRDFLDKEHQETLRSLRDELFDLQKNPEGGVIPWMREGRIGKLKEELKNPQEKPIEDVLRKFLEESEDARKIQFDLQDSLVQANKLMELFDEESSYRAPNFAAEFPLRAHLAEPGIKDYLRDGHSYINRVSSDALREMLAESLLGIKPGSKVEPE